MSSIDERIVEMRFNNRQFEQGIKETNSSLDKLKQGLKLEGAASGLDEIAEASSKISFQAMADGVANVSNKFNALGAIGFSVIQNLTNQVLGFGQKVLGAALDPIFEGGKRRAQNIEQAKFQFAGLGVDIEKAMAAANYAVDGTAFGLDEAARAASQLAASDVPLDKMGDALRGISGVAAMTNSSYEDMSQVFTTVAGNGRLMANELNRISARGLNAAAALAKYLGVTEKEVRDMTSKGKIDFQTFADAMNDAFGDQATKANETYSGSLSNVRAALARIGATHFTVRLEAMRNIFNALRPAIDAVHEVLKPLLGVMNDEMMSGSANVVKMLEKFTEGITSLQNNTKFVDHLEMAFKNIVSTFKTLGSAIKDGFTTIFPEATETQLESIAEGIRTFTQHLLIGTKTADNLKRTFAGFFAIFGIGWEILKNVVKMVMDLFGATTKGSFGILEFTGNIGDFLVSLHKAIKEGEGLTRFFEGLGNVLKTVIDFFKAVFKMLGSLGQGFDKIDLSGFAGLADKLKARFEPLTGLGQALANVWDGVMRTWAKVAEFFAPLASWLGQAFGDLSDKITNAIQNMDYSALMDLANTGIFATLATGIGLFMKKLSDGLNIDFGGGFLESAKGILDGLTGSLEAMQTNLKAKTLLTIAGALAILTASVIALSLIDSEGLTRALTAMTVMFAQLGTSLLMFQKILNPAQAAQLVIMAASFILLGIALNILASAVRKLSELDWGELAKGLTGVTVLIGGLVGASQLMKANAGGMISSGLALILLATALNIMASAVIKLSGLDWGELAKGLSGVAGSLIVIAGAMRIMPKGMVAQGVALLVIAAALNVLASAVTKFGAIDWDTMGRGLAGLAGSMVAIAGAMQLMPKGIVAQAVGLIVVATALNMLAGALASMGGMSWEEIAKSLVMLAGSLLILAGALYLMQSAISGALAMIIVAGAISILVPALQGLGSMSWEEIAKGLVMLAGSLLILAGGMYLMTAAIAGAAALLVVSAALTILVPVLQALGGMSWEEIGRGLVALAGAFAVIGIAGLLLTPLVPTLLALGAAITLIGVGVALAGAGLFLFAAGVTALSVAGAAGTTAIVAMASALIGLIPMVLEQIGHGIIALAGVIRDGAPAIIEAVVALIVELLNAVTTLVPELTAALVVIVQSLLDAIVTLTPEIINAMVVLIQTLVEAVVTMVPFFVDAGLRLLTGILDGIGNNIGQVIESATNIVVNFIDGIAANLPRVIDSGINLVVSFVQGLADGIRNNTAAMQSAGIDLAMAIIDGMTGGLASGVGRVISAAQDVASSALSAAKDFLGINSPSKEFQELGMWSDRGLAGGLKKHSGEVEKEAIGVGKTALSSMTKALSGVANAVDGEVDMSPKIRPVLDLSDVKKSSMQLDGLITPDRAIRISPEETQKRARRVSFDKAELDEYKFEVGTNTPKGDTYVEFNQTNTSPKALSTSEIYRRTNNQISRMKEAVGA